MKPSNASSNLRPDPSKPVPRWLALALLVGALAAANSGCVMRGTHALVVEERDGLVTRTKEMSERMTLLEASNESLSGERVQLIEEIEELRIAREALESDRAELTEQVAELTARRDQLEMDLAQRDQLVESEQREVVKLRSTYDGLVEDLQAEVAAGRIEVEQLREGVRVRLAQEVLFPKGSAQVAEPARLMLRKVAGRLVGDDQRIEVHGHTDDLAIGGRLAEIYPSNWELAGARAAAVLRLLERYGVPPDRMTAVSFGPHRPVAPNADAESRARNRRIEIRLVPKGDESPASGDDGGMLPRDEVASEPSP